MVFVDIQAQYQAYKLDIDRRIHTVLDHGRFIMGPEVYELEQVLSNYVDSKHCVTVSSGTDSLEIALRALGIGPGDEVITVPFTWVSTAEAIALVGATPVFVDIREDSFNMDPAAAAAAVTPKTKAIIPVSLFGQMPEIESITAICDRHGLALIEDGAQSFGAVRNGIRSCGVPSVGSTSFFPAKTLGCFGDGGALFTSDDHLASRMRAIRNHGGEIRHHHHLVGMNGRFDTIQAAVILAKFPHFEEELERRRQIARRYDDALVGYCGLPTVASGNRHVFAQYTIRSSRRDQLADCLSQAGIPTGVYYPKCLHEQPVFASLGYKRGQFPVAEKAGAEVLSLPLHPFLSDTDQSRVADAVVSFFRS